MKKLLTYLGFGLGILIALFVVLVVLAPTALTITCTSVIQQDQQTVFDHLRSMAQFPRWSPWRVQDPEQRYTLSGTDGEIGATFSWQGVAEESVGHQTITELTGNSGLTIACVIEKPFPSNPEYRYALRAVPGGTEVTQTFSTHLGRPTNAIAVLIGPEGEIRSTNQLGLARLAQLVETGSAGAAK
ncbi:MAG: SRPBCC family protein [Flavobacteriales bacterium]|jgi:hypothetical protein|nr:SRPBCC family protein [Flavobacteriales bacterium]